MEIKLPAFEKKFTICKTHGDNIPALLNGNCSLCYLHENNSVNATQFRNNFEKQIKKSMLPTRYLKSTFDNYIPTCDKASQLKQHLQTFDFKKNVLLVGKTGTGKTHLACALINKAIKQNISCLYLPFYRAINYKIHDKALFERVLSCQMLVIDEYGVQDSGFKKELLQEIIDERYLESTDNDPLITILISNLKLSPSLEDIANGNKTGFLIDSIHDATRSRLKENFFHCVEIDWEDYRVTK